jgi:hypothetical protein
VAAYEHRAMMCTGPMSRLHHKLDTEPLLSEGIG